MKSLTVSVSMVFLLCGYILPVSTEPMVCGVCEVSECPKLKYCEGEEVKDPCNCCTVCSKSKFQPHVVITQPSGANACDQVKCPKFKVCMENMQGVPLCTCPSEFVCRRHISKKKEVCGNDGKTYPSRCHMGIASCNQGLAVRKKYRGACSPDDQKRGEERYKKRIRKMNKRRNRNKFKTEKAKKEKENRGNKKRRQKRRQKRRNIGNRNSNAKRRTRRHRGLDVFGGKASYRSKPVRRYKSRRFEKSFPNYTWDS